MAVLLLVAACAGGVALTLFDDEEHPLHLRLAAGSALGLALASLIGYVAASFLGLNGGSVALAALLSLAPAAALPRRRWRALRPARPALASAAPAAALALLLLLVFDRAYYETPSGIFTGVEHNTGDLPFHLGIISSFTEAMNIPPEHPELSGVRLTYPFLADFGVAQLVTASMGRRDAMLVHNVVLGLALLALLHGFARRVTGDAAAAALAPALLFLSGGLGFVRLWDESRSTGVSLFEMLGRLPYDFTINSAGELRFGNTFICLLTTQRSLLFGTPLVLIVLSLLWRAASSNVEVGRRRRLLAAAGAVAGLLPLVHGHALAVLLAVAAALMLLFPPRRDWLAFFGVAAALVVPQALWLASGSSMQPKSFFA